jgi:hypothetical protein
VFGEYRVPLAIIYQGGEESGKLQVIACDSEIQIPAGPFSKTLKNNIIFPKQKRVIKNGRLHFLQNN